MGTAVDRILQLWKETFEEEGWHTPVLAALDGLTAPQAAWKPSPERHSVWQIADHLAFWKEYMLRRLRGAPRRPTGWAKGLDWRAIPEVTEAAWTAAVQRLVDAQAALKAELGLRTDEDLEKPYPTAPSLYIPSRPWSSTTHTTAARSVTFELSKGFPRRARGMSDSGTLHRS